MSSRGRATALIVFDLALVLLVYGLYFFLLKPAPDSDHLHEQTMMTQDVEATLTVLDGEPPYEVELKLTNRTEASQTLTLPRGIVLFTSDGQSGSGAIWNSVLHDPGELTLDAGQSRTWTREVPAPDEDVDPLYLGVFINPDLQTAVGINR